MTALAGRKGLSLFWIVCLLLTLVVGMVVASQVRADDEEKPFDVLRGFTEAEVVVSDIVEISEQRKHQILFLMGFVLLITIITAAMLGVAMVVFGKQVFLAHMIFAGISVFLSIVHAVTAIVWFFPF
jgi:hypothetical protein